MPSINRLMDALAPHHKDFLRVTLSKEEFSALVRGETVTGTSEHGIGIEISLQGVDTPSMIEALIEAQKRSLAEETK